MTAPVVPTTLSPIHLYRQLLREISYLPPAFSISIASIIRTRFHNHLKQDALTKKRLSRGRAVLRQIRAANHGNRTSMLYLIDKGFGRAGPRRRELMVSLVQKEGPQDSKSLEEALEVTNSAEVRAKKHKFLDIWNKPKLLALLKSQTHQEGNAKSAQWLGRGITSLNENALVPKLNTWGRPPAENLVRAKHAKWWKRSADKIMPPLGKGEWDLLSRLAKGAQEEEDWSIPPRRTPAISPSQLTESESWDWKRYATEPVAKIEDRMVSRWRRYYGDADPNPFAHEQKSRQGVSDRWFRRAYGRTWVKTAHVEQDPASLKYAFEWGSKDIRSVAPRGVQIMLFEGVDTQGKPL